MNPSYLSDVQSFYVYLVEVDKQDYFLMIITYALRHQEVKMTKQGKSVSIFNRRIQKIHDFRINS